VPPPVSYATVRYWALHAFIWRDRQGQRQAVRYRWEPDAGVASLSDEDLEAQPPDYLTQEMTDRLLHEPASFTLRVQLAEPGDPTDDPTIAWPDDRPEVVAGRLELTAPVDDQAYWDAQAFSPAALTDGIEVSDDPILAFRRRTAEGTPPTN
jgi:catalase